jgi:threonine/homoserine/homoserine lactone efflux protein
MELIFTFFIAFFFSFIGTIPPGTLNLTVIQLGLDQRLRTAWRFSLGAAIIEYLYGWLAVKFDTLIISSTAMEENFKLITGIVMLVLGIGTLLTARRKPSQLIQKFNESGFRRGVVLGLLNPLALPFWIAMTAYIRSQKWIDLSSELEIHTYLLGVALGGFALLMSLAYLANKIVVYFQESGFLKKIPGYTLIVLGIYAIMQYLL